MTFDIPTAMHLSATMTLVIGLGLAFAATGYPRTLQYPVRLWVTGLLLQPVPYLLFAFRGEIPDLLSVVVANVLLVCGFAIQMHALRVFNQRPDRVAVIAGLVGLTLVGQVLLTHVWPSPGSRIVFVSLIISALACFGIGAIYRKNGHISRAEHLVGVILLLGIVLMFVRIIAQGGAATSSLIAYSPMQGVVFTYTSLMPVIATAAFMLMCGERLNADLTRLATLDPLTGVYNRRTMTELATRAIADATRRARPLSLLALDIDHFKRINDEFGHEAGDAALCTFVELVRSSLRREDLISRLGGEEFVVVLPDTDENTAGLLAERVRERIADPGFAIAGWPVQMRVSIGVAALGSEVGDLKTLLRAADLALYAAKRGGRNRVVAASQNLASAAESGGKPEHSGL